jgi:hypothetical protein
MDNKKVYVYKIKLNKDEYSNDFRILIDEDIENIFSHFDIVHKMNKNATLHELHGEQRVIALANLQDDSE